MCKSVGKVYKFVETFNKINIRSELLNTSTLYLLFTTAPWFYDQLRNEATCLLILNNFTVTALEYV